MKRVGAALLAAGGVFLAATALADESQLTVAPSIDMAFKKSDFWFGAAGTSGNQLIKPTFTTLTPAIAMSYGRFYGVANYEVTVNDWNSDKLSGIGSTWTVTQDSFERNEASVTLGMRVFSGNKYLGPANIFVGYLKGESVWHNNEQSGNTSGFSYYNNRYIFSEDGFYLGASYTHPFGEKGSLSFSAAYGKLNGNLAYLSQSYNSVAAAAYGDDWDYLSNAVGYSLGVVWTGPITGNLHYRVGMKHISYDYDITEMRNNLTGTAIAVPAWFDLKIHEYIYSFFFGVTNYF